MLHKSLLSISLILLVLFSNAQIATGIINLPNDNAEDRLKVMQQQLYELIKATPELTNNFNLQQFIYDNQLNSLDFIHLTGKYMAQGNTAMVDFLLNYWNGQENTLAENYHQYYKWVVEMYKNTEYKPNAEDVYALANKCPLKEGVIIYAFRNLYNSLTRTNNKFTENCDGAAAKGVKKQAGFIRVKQPKVKAFVKQETTNNIVYPNPASTVIKLVEKNVTAVQIIDVLGNQKLVIKNIDGLQSINISALANGLYFVKVQKADGSYKISKLIIQH